MRFLVIDVKNGDMFDKAYATREEAIAQADREWNSLTEYDKKQRECFYVLESVTDDEEAENRFDGNVIKEYK